MRRRIRGNSNATAHTRTTTAILLASAVAAMVATTPATAQQRPPKGLAEKMVAPATAQANAIKALHWRSIGPANMAGRTAVVLGTPGDPSTFWVAGADGGVWKTTNNATTWQPQFENQAVYSPGALAMAPSDHNVIWLGTGEGDPRNSASFGNGVYRSTNGGDTWKYLGLDDTERIKRIVVHPTNPNVALVCALGHAWGPNEMRGVFRTTDAGKTWQKVLYIDQDTGCSDISMDPSNPRILYAGMYWHRRRPWRLDSGGKTTALYKSIDGGDTWVSMRGRPGYPTEAMDRIGVAVAPSSPNTVYMITETLTQGELFRSDDAGATWRMTTADRNINFRPFYYADIRVDPSTPERVYALSGSLNRSINGGHTFQNIGQGVHGDHQAFWIDPTNPKRLLSGSDGGFQVSWDGGDNWTIMNNISFAQFYHIDFDMRQPYFLCGGLQDNGDWCGPSRTTYGEGILKDDWYTVHGGDGFYSVPVPDQPWIIFSNSQGGSIDVMDLRSGNSRSIHPDPNRVGSAGDALASHKYRFNWDSPILVSPNDPKVVYFGGNVLFKSSDRGSHGR